MDKIIESIFEDFRNSKEDMELQVDHIKDKLGNLSKRIILYGAGSAGIAFYRYLVDAGFEILAFADGSQLKWETYIENIEIISPEEISKRFGDEVLIIVTINTDGKKYCRSFEDSLRDIGHDGVHLWLKSLGYNNIIDYSVFRKCYDLFIGDRFNLPSCSDVYCMLKNEEKIIKAFELFEEEKSKDIFSSIIKFRLIDDNISIPTDSMDDDYFEYDIYSKIKDECFIDCGAYDGNTLERFLERNGEEFLEYVAFEPDSNNMKKLITRVDELPSQIKTKITLLEKAVGNFEGTGGFYQLNGPGSFSTTDGNTYVEYTSMDNILVDKKPTLIKMNIEGDEIGALMGAKDIIKKYKPLLIISSYHKTWDIWEIPLLIKAYYEGYKFYMRSYMNHISFKCYAVPPNRVVDKEDKVYF